MIPMKRGSYGGTRSDEFGRLGGMILMKPSQTMKHGTRSDEFTKAEGGSEGQGVDGASLMAAFDAEMSGDAARAEEAFNDDDVYKERINQARGPRWIRDHIRDLEEVFAGCEPDT